MINGFSIDDTDTYSVEHLYDSVEIEKLIESFSVSEKTAVGLENYLKFTSFTDEETKMARTYVVKDKTTGELAGYFSMRTGLITQQINSDDDLFDSIPAVELSNFSVNSTYKEKHPDIPKLGIYIFYTFILPLAKSVSNYIGVNTLYIYALPNEKLIDHYKTMGFRRLSPKSEQFVQSHVKPKYDEGCIFMYQTI